MYNTGIIPGHFKAIRPWQAIINTLQQCLAVKHNRTLKVDSAQSYSSYNEHRFIADSVPVPDAQLCHALVNSNLTSKATSFDKFNAVEQQFKNKNKMKKNTLFIALLLAS